MSANVTTKTVFKMFGVPAEGRITREDFEKDAKDLRDAIKHLNPAEAEKVAIQHPYVHQ
jgi:protein-arginine kinase activator protein McsA